MPILVKRWQWTLVMALLILAISFSFAVVGFFVWKTYFDATTTCAACHVHLNNTVMISNGTTS
jgi:hypothetical protein